MKRFLIISLIIIAAIAVVVFVSLRSSDAQVCINNVCFNVEVADSSVEQNRGLMFRKELALNEGMLFIFEKEENHPFWMENTYIPLDIIWFNSDKEVVFISKNTQPCSDTCPLIDPERPAKYVLEINPGTVTVSMWDKLEIKNSR